MFKCCRKIEGAGKRRDPGVRMPGLQGQLHHLLSPCVTRGRLLLTRPGPQWPVSKVRDRGRPSLYTVFSYDIL